MKIFIKKTFIIKNFYLLRFNSQIPDNIRYFVYASLLIDIYVTKI
jgi:hypothetical protein